MKKANFIKYLTADNLCTLNHCIQIKFAINKVLIIVCGYCKVKKAINKEHI